MSKDEIIQMAEDCGIRHRYYEIPVSKKGVVTVESCTDRLLKFAELVVERHEWVGLTTSEVIECQEDSIYNTYINIETKLKEKNVPQP